ncbi:MAG: galactose-1-phosphate uridylyltransferase [Methanomicrobiaceae archaeon]|nr:galactose-1-phosphate uridylyltransferase [Methanomicrobiaceae archaeon]
MFSITRINLHGQNTEFRKDKLTGLRCRINPSREERNLNHFIQPVTFTGSETCPFCPDNIEKMTPCFDNGKRIKTGESVTFPNSFPFGENHIVTVMTRKHYPGEITENQITDSLRGQYDGLYKKEDYNSINWNYLTSAGASMIHPHLQGFSGRVPTYLNSLYIEKSREYFQKKGKNYWQQLSESEKESERYLFGDEIVWCANPVPIGEKEIRGYLPICSFEEFREFIPEASAGIKKVIGIYQKAGNHAFNMSIRFGKSGHESYFRAHISMIARIDPNPMSFTDSAFMERLHFEPVIMTVPEMIRERYGR